MGGSPKERSWASRETEGAAGFSASGSGGLWFPVTSESRPWVCEDRDEGGRDP